MNAEEAAKLKKEGDRKFDILFHEYINSKDMTDIIDKEMRSWVTHTSNESIPSDYLRVTLITHFEHNILYNNKIYGRSVPILRKSEVSKKMEQYLISNGYYLYQGYIHWGDSAAEARNKANKVSIDQEELKNWEKKNKKALESLNINNSIPPVIKEQKKMTGFEWLKMLFR